MDTIKLLVIATILLVIGLVLLITENITGNHTFWPLVFFIPSMIISITVNIISRKQTKEMLRKFYES